MTIKEIEALLKKGWSIESLCYDEDYKGYTASVANKDGDIAIRGAANVLLAIEKAVDTLRMPSDIS